MIPNVIPMDLSLFLSITAIVVSVSMSIITLMLTEFRGPNISLLNDPEFKVNDESFAKAPIRDYTPRWFHLKEVPFVFANHGGKSGTILELKLDFVPHNSFRCFFDRFYAGMIMYEGDLSPPVTIKEGDNEYLKTFSEIRTIDWKETALAEVLDSNLKIDDIIEKAWERSKENFKSFCDFLDESQEFGKVSCTLTLTKGRFRSTKVTNEKILEDIPIENRLDEAVSSLRGCLQRWEDLEPTKLELSNKVKRDLEGLARELKENLIILERKVHGVSLSGASKLRVNDWNQLQRVRTLQERKIRWFLINCEDGLKEDLTKLYEHIVKYNRSIDEFVSLGAFGTQRRFRQINVEREKLCSDTEKMWMRLSSLHRRSIS